ALHDALPIFQDALAGGIGHVATIAKHATYGHLRYAGGFGNIAQCQRPARFGLIVHSRSIPRSEIFLLISAKVARLQVRKHTMFSVNNPGPGGPSQASV